MLEKGRRALDDVKGGYKSVFYPYGVWIRNFAFIAITFVILFSLLKYLVEIFTGASFYVTVKSTDLIIYLLLLILSLIVEMRLHQISIHSKL
jgi:hypothetical protein